MLMRYRPDRRLATYLYNVAFRMEKLARDVEGAHKLLENFGFFPVFHDGEVVSVVLDRNKVSATMTFLVPAYENSKYVGDLEVILIFFGIEDIRLEGFNHQNVISSLTFEKVIGNPKSLEVDSSRTQVDLDTVFGMWATFSCSKVCVESVSKVSQKTVVNERTK